MASDPTGRNTRLSLKIAHAELASWLRESAYPLWSTQGMDLERGGFHERLTMGGEPLAEARRARVQPRQACAFSQAPALGWGGDASQAITHALDYFFARYRRPDGFFITLASPDGAPLDERVLLYDQAFALLALAECQRVLGPRPDYVKEAAALRTLLYGALKRPNFGFDTGLPGRLPLLSNPHMHLFEASLAWIAIDDDPAWRMLADEIASLALRHFIDPVSGALREAFDAQWRPLAGTGGQIVEPGHQFEWAWLLMRWSERGHPQARSAALRLIEVGEQHGVRGGVAINALLDDFSVKEGTARLWPQTERIKAALVAARLTGDARYWTMADAAVQGFRRFLATKMRGLWHDRLTLENDFVNEPAPASSFYHIVAAIKELADSVN